MVLVHKLKQMEAIDIEQFREVPPEVISYDAPREAELADASEDGAGSQPEIKRTICPPRRPTTRSQTGRVAKRRGGEYSVFEKEPPTRSKSLTIDVGVEDKIIETQYTPVEREMSTETSVSANASAVVAGQYTFLGTSSTTPGYDRRGPRSRATLPVPVPNLTKKSRGRRVPTKAATDNGGSVQKAARLYACPVVNCLKCFNRGEHLKRHIRSIHTNEKPFACSYPSCDKFFNRHDNLLQHLKVHKDFTPPPRDGPLQPPSPQHNIQSESDTFNSPLSTANTMLPPTYTTSPAYHIPSTGFVTNIAVSSLRTELPHSPTADTSSRAARERLTSPLYRPSAYENEGRSPLLLRPIAPQHDWQA